MLTTTRSNNVIRLDRLVTRIDADGVPTAFIYDDTGRLTSATRQAQSVKYVYDAAGRLTQKIQPNGNVCNYRYDDANRLLSLQWMNGTRPLHGNTYSYDANSNRITSTEITGSGTRFWAYRYDSLNQLTHAVLNNRFQLAYQYDAVGNLTHRTISRLHGKDEDKEDDGDVDFVDVTLIEKLGHNTDFACNDKDQVTSSGDISYSWDRNGNLIGKTEGGKTTTYTWNARGLLAKVEFHDGQSEEFSYNGDGLMVRKTSRDRQSVTYVWTGAEVLNEYDNKGRTKASYLLGSTREGLSLPRGKHSRSYWNVSDGSGSVVGLSNHRGELTDHYQYDPWGNPIATDGGTYNPYRFVGAYGCRTEDQSGLVYMRARFYSPALQRFISRDPLGLSAGLNRYLYAGNNPLSHIDPLGLDWLQNLQYISGKILEGVGLGLTLAGGVAEVTGGTITLTGVGAPAGAALVLAGSTAMAVGGATAIAGHLIAENALAMGAGSGGSGGVSGQSGYSDSAGSGSRLFDIEGSSLRDLRKFLSAHGPGNPLTPENATRAWNRLIQEGFVPRAEVGQQGQFFTDVYHVNASVIC